MVTRLASAKYSVARSGARPPMPPMMNFFRVDISERGEFASADDFAFMVSLPGLLPANATILKA